ncbi:MAG TPA: GNAT family protein [Actinokineospora sp.]|nr:GNAT family protein [Actinokineospora sp.]
MRLRGYRDSDRDLLAGHWLPGELIGLPLTDRPPLAEPTTVSAPVDDRAELCVADGIGFARFAEVDWVHRRARLEIGLRPDAADAAEQLVGLAVEHGLRVLNLHRVHGWVTPATTPRTDILARAGFQREAVLPDGAWHAGRAVDREIWGMVRHD